MLSLSGGIETDVAVNIVHRIKVEFRVFHPFRVHRAVEEAGAPFLDSRAVFGVRFYEVEDVCPPLSEKNVGPLFHRLLVAQLVDHAPGTVAQPYLAVRFGVDDQIVADNVIPAVVYHHGDHRVVEYILENVGSVGIVVDVVPETSHPVTVHRSEIVVADADGPSVNGSPVVHRAAVFGILHNAVEVVVLDQHVVGVVEGDRPPGRMDKIVVGDRESRTVLKMNGVKEVEDQVRGGDEVVVEQHVRPLRVAVPSFASAEHRERLTVGERKLTVRHGKIQRPVEVAVLKAHALLNGSAAEAAQIQGHAVTEVTFYEAPRGVTEGESAEGDTVRSLHPYHVASRRDMVISLGSVYVQSRRMSVDPVFPFGVQLPGNVLHTHFDPVPAVAQVASVLVGISDADRDHLIFTVITGHGAGILGVSTDYVTVQLHILEISRGIVRESFPEQGVCQYHMMLVNGVGCFVQKSVRSVFIFVGEAGGDAYPAVSEQQE